MPKLYFKEKQRFNHWWIIAIVTIVTGLWLWAFIQQIILGIPFGTRPAPDLALIIILVLVLIPVLIFAFHSMHTEIRSDGIYYRLAPIMRSKKIKTEDITEWHLRKYKPVREFGGWGIRFSFRKKGSKTYNVKGKSGLQLKLDSGKKILIGTQKPEEIEKAMEKLLPDKNLSSS
ncbi:MAG: DUF6141 family protein [Bacteroidales bacterium]|nr:DUF6141 family protein [Bacteroidales bacterium]MCF8345347.1 DUF6141 family protein [Bacteroidales bacterium]MCF8375728.1 DUF6141 family protein [Bacteroidales bacterium]MCF8400328.1 DUF6141 family protein [Bacteroidales bacterium]